MAVLELTFRNVSLGKWSKNWSCYRRKQLEPWLELELQSNMTPVAGRLQGLPVRDCARGCNNRAQMCTQLSAIDVTARTFFERLYLVVGLRKIAPWVNCSYASTTLILQWTTISRFLCNVFPRTAPHFFPIMIHQVIWPSPGTLIPSHFPITNCDGTATVQLVRSPS